MQAAGVPRAGGARARRDRAWRAVPSHAEFRAPRRRPLRRRRPRRAAARADTLFESWATPLRRRTAWSPITEVDGNDWELMAPRRRVGAAERPPPTGRCFDHHAPSCGAFTPRRSAGGASPRAQAHLQTHGPMAEACVVSAKLRITTPRVGGTVTVTERALPASWLRWPCWGSIPANFARVYGFTVLRGMAQIRGRGMRASQNRAVFVSFTTLPSTHSRGTSPR